MRRGLVLCVRVQRQHICVYMYIHTDIGVPHAWWLQTIQCIHLHSARTHQNILLTFTHDVCAASAAAALPYNNSIRCLQNRHTYNTHGLAHTEHNTNRHTIRHTACPPFKPTQHNTNGNNDGAGAMWLPYLLTEKLNAVHDALARRKGAHIYRILARTHTQTQTHSPVL